MKYKSRLKEGVKWIFFVKDFVGEKISFENTRIIPD